MKKNRMMRLASILLVCVLLTTSVISGTFAKYISDAEAEDTARVAKWEIIYTNETDDSEGVDITGTSETIYVNLFNTVNEADTSTAETNVKTDSTTAIVAPGTGGSFTMKVENKSEVTAKYSVVLSEEENDGLFIQYSLDKKAWADDIAELNDNEDYLKEVELAMENGFKEITVYWRWVFDKDVDKTGHADQDNEADTALGASVQDGNKYVTVKATLTVTQVD